MANTKVYIIWAVLAFFVSGFNNPDKAKSLAGDYTLFKIDRSRDPDIVLYDVKLDPQGNLDTTSPITVYWKKFTKDGALQSLTGIQKRFGYGITFENISKHSAAFTFVSSLDRVFTLNKSGNKLFRVYTEAGGKKIEVQKLYIHFEDDSFWFPKISRIEITGIDAMEGSIVSESIIP